MTQSRSMPPRNVVEQLCATLMRQPARLRAMRHLKGGLHTQTLRLQATAGAVQFSFVLRLYPALPDQADLCRREWAALTALKHTNFRAPTPLWSDPEGSLFGRAATAMSLMAGSPPRSTTRSMWTQVASALANLHSLNPGGLHEFLAEEPGGLPGALGEVVRAGWAQVLTEPQRFLHGDICMPNTLFSRRRLVGFVDWTSAVSGPPSRDLASLWLDARLFGPEGAGEDVLSTYAGKAGSVPSGLRAVAALGALRSADRLDDWVYALRQTGGSVDRQELGRRYEDLVRELTNDPLRFGGH